MKPMHGMSGILQGRPSFYTGLLVSSAAVTALALLRFAAFPDNVVPVGYAAVLLLVLWHRDLRLLWGTVAACAALSLLRAWALPMEGGSAVVFIAMHVANISIVAAVLHTVIISRRHLHAINASLEQSNTELEAANEELAAGEEQILQQNEELRNQAEELEQQTDELTQQTEEIQAQSEELRVMNDDLAEREATLAMLLNLTQDAQSEEQLLEEICATTPRLLAPNAVAAALYEQHDDRLIALASSGLQGEEIDLPMTRALGGHVLERRQAAHISNLSLRSDVVVPTLENGERAGSVLSAPVYLEQKLVGVLEVYAAGEHEWSDRHVSMLQWLSAQCTRAWRSVRLREDLLERTREAEAKTALVECLLDYIPAGITVAEGHDVVIREVSRYGLDLLNRTAEEMVGTPQHEHADRWYLLQSDGDRAEVSHHDLPLARATIKGEQVRDEEWVVVRGDGEEVIVSCSAGPIRDSKGKIIGGVNAFRDITRAKRTEQLLRQREAELLDLTTRLEAKVAKRTAELEQQAGDLRRLASQLSSAEHRERRRIAQVLHDDLQQLLVAAQMRISAAAEAAPETAEQVRELISQAIQSSRTLTAELSPPVLFEERFETCLQWLARRMEQQHGLRVIVEGDPDVDPPDEDWRVFLFTAVGECLFNAVKHARVEEARVRLRREEGALRIDVEDDGVGFDVEDARKRARGGESFGLFNVRQRVELMGGYTMIRSAPGKGTRVTLGAPAAEEAELSVADATATEVQPAAKGKVSVLQRRKDQKVMRVLLADDHEMVRDGIAKSLDTYVNIEVVAQAKNGIEAVQLVEDQQPDVVVMDISMPVMGGVEATRRIHERWPGVRIIGMSMHEDDELANAMRRAGAVSYVVKGAPVAQLAAEVLGESETADEQEQSVNGS